MKKLFFILILLFVLIYPAFSQTLIRDVPVSEFVGETAVSVGFGLGGNSLLGADLETMFLPRIGAKLGVGISGFSAGVNYYLYPTVQSSYCSLQAWQSGFGNDYKAVYLGPIFVYRASRLFQAGLGVGYALDKKDGYQLKNDYIISFNLGLYFPI